MKFFERYLALCNEKKIPPMAQSTADNWQISNAAITNWKKRDNIPKGDIIVRIADFFCVSTDYILCRTDDRTDYAHEKPAFSENEMRLIHLFRSANEQVQNGVFAFLEGSISDDQENKKAGVSA